MTHHGGGVGTLIQGLESNVFAGTSCGERSGFIVTALVSGSSGPGLSPSREHCVVFLGETLYSHSASLHPGV